MGVRYEAQRRRGEGGDCAVAALAMFTGLSYDQVWHDHVPYWGGQSDRSIQIDQMADYVRQHRGLKGCKIIVLWYVNPERKKLDGVGLCTHAVVQDHWGLIWDSLVPKHKTGRVRFSVYKRAGAQIASEIMPWGEVRVVQEWPDFPDVPVPEMAPASGYPLISDHDTPPGYGLIGYDEEMTVEELAALLGLEGAEYTAWLAQWILPKGYTAPVYARGPYTVYINSDDFIVAESIAYGGMVESLEGLSQHIVYKDADGNPIEELRTGDSPDQSIGTITLPEGGTVRLFTKPPRKR